MLRVLLNLLLVGMADFYMVHSTGGISDLLISDSSALFDALYVHVIICLFAW